MRRPDRSLALLVANKHRYEGKAISLEITPLPPRWAAMIRTMGRGDEDFVYQGHRSLENGVLRLHLSPLTLALVTIPAPPHDTFAFGQAKTHATRSRNQEERPPS